MQKKEETFCDAIFIIVDEESCPLYCVGEEIKVENSSLSMSSYKPGCLYLARRISSIVASKESFRGFSKISTQKTRFDCGGCEGLIHFEYKKERGFATLQMKLLEAMEEKRRRKHLEKYFGVLRKLKLFAPLEDDALEDLTLLLEFKIIPFGKPVVKKGTPGTNFFIILEGKVEIKADDGTKLVDLGEGEMFGEMGLLSSEPFQHSIYSVNTTLLAILSVKNFKQILKKFPVLQMFIFKLLVDRAQSITLRSGNIASGMTGKLSEISPVDLLQLINSSQKTGTVDLNLERGRGMVFFKEGEIVYARYLQFKNEQAVYELLGLKNGNFSYTKGIPEVLENVSPIGGFMKIMMEGVQRLDESQNLQVHGDDDKRLLS
jgi:CRP/FNR family cyclic AMP-dependent transcriptional regulator